MEEKKSIDFFKRIKYAIFKVEKYSEFLEEKPNIAIKYMVQLLLIVSLILTIISTISFVNLSKKGEDFIKNNLADFTFENNKLYFSEIQEAYDETEDVYFVANTTEISSDLLEEYKNKAYDAEYAIILLEDKFLFYTGNTMNEFNYETLNQSINLQTLNKVELVELIDNNGITKMAISIFGVTGLSLYFAEILSIAMNVILLYIFGYIMCKIVSVPLNNNSIFNISIYSITLSVILSLIYNIVYHYTKFEIQYFDTMYLIIAYIYIIAAIFIIKSDLLKQKVEVQKIIEVQKEVAKDIQEEKEKEKEKKQEEEKDRKEKKDEEEKKPDNTEPDGSEI